jgi:hypothetical protein
MKNNRRRIILKNHQKWIYALIRLIYRGQPLQDGKTIFDYKVGNDSTLHLFQTKNKPKVEISSSEDEEEVYKKKDEEIKEKAIKAELKGPNFICTPTFEACKTMGGDIPYFTDCRLTGVWFLDETDIQKLEKKNFSIIFNLGEIEVADQEKFEILRFQEDRHFQEPRFRNLVNIASKKEGDQIIYQLNTSIFKGNEKFRYFTFGRKSDQEDPGCLVCKGHEEEDKIILCEECDGQYHIYCLNPPLKPEDLAAIDNWYCPRCFKNPHANKKNAAKPKKPTPSELTTKKWGGGMACSGRSKKCEIVPENVKMSELKKKKKFLFPSSTLGRFLEFL